MGRHIKMYYCMQRFLGKGKPVSTAQSSVVKYDLPTASVVTENIIQNILIKKVLWILPIAIINQITITICLFKWDSTRQGVMSLYYDAIILSMGYFSFIHTNLSYSHMYLSLIHMYLNVIHAHISFFFSFFYFFPFSFFLSFFYMQDWISLKAKIAAFSFYRFYINF